MLIQLLSVFDPCEQDGILYGAQFLGMVHEEEIMVREAVFGLQLELDRDPTETLPSA